MSIVAIHSPREVETRELRAYRANQPDGFLGASVTSLLSFPERWVQSIRQCFTAVKFSNTEALFDNAVRICHIPIGIILALDDLQRRFETFLVPLLSFVMNPEVVMQISQFLSTILVKPLVISAGFVFVSLNLLLEVVRFLRIVRFRLEVQPKKVLSLIHQITEIEKSGSLEQLRALVAKNRTFFENRIGKAKVDQTLASTQDNVTATALKLSLLAHTILPLYAKYFTVSPEMNERVHRMLPRGSSEQEIFAAKKNVLNMQLHRLTKRIGVQHALKMGKWATHYRLHILRHFDSSTPASFCETSHDLAKQNSIIEKGVTLLETIDKQTKKILLVHTIGITVLLLTIVSSALSFLAPPTLLVLPLTITIIALNFFRSFGFPALVEQKGWRWDFVECLSPFLQSKTSPR